MGSYLKKFSDWMALVVGGIVVLMMLHVTAEVLVRVGFDMHIPGTMEVVTYYYMVSAVFMGIFACTTEDGHIRVDVLAQFLKGRVRLVVEVIGLVVMAVYFAIFSYGLYLQAVKSWARSETVDAIFLELPVWPSRWIAVAGMVLSVLSVLYLFRFVCNRCPDKSREPGQ
ncbi:TRAP transporter small permease subunit [Marinobacter caseinilyticus]|uniref:TRAP transporter small permease subunit n=1 Tax=Marinobacter caseinilyticus TaxID=2692195 RepID=UPI00140822D8|nr:TRAP transporter small permease [Marinobacter caseinilyticus]